MSASTQNRDNVVGVGRSIPLPSPSLHISAVQLPANEIVTVKRKDDSGKVTDKKQQTTQIPFSCKLEIGSGLPAESVTALGLAHRPRGEFDIKLEEVKGEKLTLTMSPTYLKSETRYREVSYNHHWEPEGQRYPYGPVEPGYMDCDTRQVPYEEQVENEEHHIRVPVDQTKFNVIYLGLVNSDTSSTRAKELLTYLHQNHSAECIAAQGWIREELAAIAQRAKQEALRAADVYSGVKLPKIGG